MSDKTQQETNIQERFSWQDINSLKFVARFFFSFVVMTLCIVQLVSSDGENNNNEALYWGGITGILAWWMPSPTSPRSTSGNQYNDFGPVRGSVTAGDTNVGLNPQPQAQLTEANNHSSRITRR